jgi:hypothetical protein
MHSFPLITLGVTVRPQHHAIPSTCDPTIDEGQTNMRARITVGLAEYTTMAYD